MKFCPRCGTPVEGSEKFCVKCGYPLNGQTSQNTQPQSSQPNQPDYKQDWNQANQTLSKAKNYSNGYFHWLFNSIKNPAVVDDNVSPYYGITSIVAGMLLVFLSFYSIINNISSIINNMADKYGGGEVGASSVIDTIKSSSVKDALLICIVSFVVYWLAGFLGRKFTSNQQLNALEYSNELATFTNAALMCDVVVFLLTLLSAYILAFYILMLTFVVYNVGLVYSIVRKSQNSGKIYAAVIASCCTPIAVTLVIKYIIHNLIMSSLNF